MIHRPTLKPFFHVEIVDSDAVALISERSCFLLKGALHCRLAPLLDGFHTADQIVDALAPNATPAEVYYALALLEDKGYIAEAVGAIAPEQAAFWHALGMDPDRAERRLSEATVSLVRFGAVSLEPFATALAELHIRVGEDGDFAVALVDDYLQQGLGDFNAAALASRRPWLLVKPVGTLLWIGPLFQPRMTGCWECLAHRLSRNREVESYLQSRKQTAYPYVSRATHPSALRIALDIAALETAKAIAFAEPLRSDGALLTLDVATLEAQKHMLIRRPQCPRCGDPESDRRPIRIELHTQVKRFTTDGGHRSVSPEQTVATYERHISPITGAVSRLTRLPTDEEQLTHVYLAGHSQGTTAGNLSALRSKLRHNSCGKGKTLAQARASGLCEALERYSGNFQGDEIRHTASYARLGRQAIHPNSCMLFSEQQYRNREERNPRVARFHQVPAPFEEDAEIEWTPVWSLTRRELRYLPTGYCYYGYPMPESSCFYRADSNGNAAGNSMEEAILQGFMELVERDSVALWWYNRVRRPAVDLDGFDEPYIQGLKKFYATRLNRDFWVLDLTSDLEIPVFAAISRRTDRTEEDIVLGFGAHFDPRIGVLRALTELNQLTPFSLTPAPEGTLDSEHLHLRCWRKTAMLANQRYLAPADAMPWLRRDYDDASSDDLREDLLRCQSIVERRGMELLVLDQTRPDIGLPVVKVVVPGLRHFWARFAPGRLYDVPVSLGWLPEPRTEDDLNPIGMFI